MLDFSYPLHFSILLEVLRLLSNLNPTSRCILLSRICWDFYLVSFSFSVCLLSRFDLWLKKFGCSYSSCFLEPLLCGHLTFQTSWTYTTRFLYGFSLSFTFWIILILFWIFTIRMIILSGVYNNSECRPLLLTILWLWRDPHTPKNLIKKN